ncbi:unnamed protein product, partial [Prorocentrum cordatum]
GCQIAGSRRRPAHCARARRGDGGARPRAPPSPPRQRPSTRSGWAVRPPRTLAARGEPLRSQAENDRIAMIPAMGQAEEKQRAVASEQVVRASAELRDLALSVCFGCKLSSSA